MEVAESDPNDFKQLVRLLRHLVLEIEFFHVGVGVFHHELKHLLRFVHDVVALSVEMVVVGGGGRHALLTLGVIDLVDELLIVFQE